LVTIGEMAHRATSLQRKAYPALERIMTTRGETANLVSLIGNERTNAEARAVARRMSYR